MKKSSIELLFTSVTSTENKEKENASNERRYVSVSFHIDNCNGSIFSVDRRIKCSTVESAKYNRDCIVDVDFRGFPRYIPCPRNRVWFV
jgi:hypothetical protein